MVFKRRKKLSSLAWVREIFLPKNGWKRAFEYISHRISRLPDTPHRIALGLSCGVMASFSPLFGFHFVIAAFLAYLVRGNIIASLAGTFFGNPLTFTFIASVSLQLGRFFVGESSEMNRSESVLGKWLNSDELRNIVVDQTDLNISNWGVLQQFLKEAFFPYMIGGVIGGLICSVIIYIIARPLVGTYQKGRKKRKRRKSKLN